MDLQVFKFGGASVKDAAAIRNAARIVYAHASNPLLVVVSAIGKTTNALEAITAAVRTDQSIDSSLRTILDYHRSVITDLLGQGHAAGKEVEALFDSIRRADSQQDYDCLYDQIVSLGELSSTRIVYHHLVKTGLPVQWIDAREYVVTNSDFREGKVLWEETEARIRTLLPLLSGSIVITQGFIGRTAQGLTTTLGREGSDFSAAIFAHCLGAASVTIWKDVPGIMNADPKRMTAATVFDELPYQEAAEMTYYGASVIHPKTIKPLANKGIPLLVKNFDDPSLTGTRIHECHVPNLGAVTVIKDNQCLISCKVTDYTFINEHQLGIIFQSLAELDLKVNLMQNSAISFSICLDYREDRIRVLIERLQVHFEVFYNTGLQLITVKNYRAEHHEEYRKRPGVVLEQASRSTLQVLFRLPTARA
jgi:aspartate kinase